MDKVVIPSSFRVGGQLIEVTIPEELDEKLGQCCVSEGYVKIADKYNGKPQSETCKTNTFVHEVIHCILDTMGRGDLSGDEVFVNTFAGFATEILYSMKFEKNGNERDKD